MSGKNRGRPRIKQPMAPQQDTKTRNFGEQFVTVQQFTALQDQMSAIMAKLQRATVQPPAAENQPTKAAHLSETTSSNNQTIPANLDNLLSQKINEAIAQRKTDLCQ
ncbi:Uncharacterized protein Fot_43277 [Forsythia ovata]|uniref:Uncharacterized protein n=1 Tax=Forsythia ovata TaxID=205694 RepID=A0ABD1RNL3_9LAMI